MGGRQLTHTQMLDWAAPQPTLSARPVEGAKVDSGSQSGRFTIAGPGGWTAI